MLRVLILVLALAAGGVAAWLTLGVQPETTSTAVAAPAPKVELEEVLVAAANLPPGHALVDADVRWQSWPEEALNPGYLTRSARPDALETLVGSVLRDGLVEGEPLRDEKLAKPGSGFLAAILPAGKRAVAVRVSAETTAGGFIRPNDHVDVIATGRESGLSNIILTNIRVLAIDQNASEAQAESASVGKTATLELDPAQAEAVASAETAGTLALALRSSADIDEAPALAHKSASTTVRILRAGRSETVSTQ